MVKPLFEAICWARGTREGFRDYRRGGWGGEVGVPVTRASPAQKVAVAPPGDGSAPTCWVTAHQRPPTWQIAEALVAAGTPACKRPPLAPGDAHRGGPARRRRGASGSITSTTSNTSNTSTSSVTSVSPHQSFSGLAPGSIPAPLSLQHLRQEARRAL
ncbi:unnamed protein product [Arctogadus glacialis]